jgi:hypothetical protein
MGSCDSHPAGRVAVEEPAWRQWDPAHAEHYRLDARPFKDPGYEELTDYDGVKLLGWLPIDSYSG